MQSKKYLNTLSIGINSSSKLPKLLSISRFVVSFANFFAPPFFFFRLAAEYSLKPIFNAPFSDIFADESDDPLFAQLLTRMKVVDANGDAEMDEDQLEAASESHFLFRVFGFRERLTESEGKSS